MGDVSVIESAVMVCGAAPPRPQPGGYAACSLTTSSSHLWGPRLERSTRNCRSVLEDQLALISHIAFSLDGQTLQTNRVDVPLPLDLIAIASPF
jgi:hypothetical protein